MKKIAADRNYRRIVKKASGPHLVYGHILNRNNIASWAEHEFGRLEKEGVNLGRLATELENLAYGAWADDIRAAIAKAKEV